VRAGIPDTYVADTNVVSYLFRGDTYMALGVPLLTTNRADFAGVDELILLP
jgi:hypothetical protein